MSISISLATKVLQGHMSLKCKNTSRILVPKYTCIHFRKVIFLKTLAIISQKGGPGKSTLAINLAVQATTKKKTSVIIDLDPQANATTWGDLREGENPLVISAQAARIKQMLKTAKEGGADLVIIDTPAKSENSALEAARNANFILTPCRPGLFDLDALSFTFDLIKMAKQDCAVVLNQVPPRGTTADETADYVRNQGFSVCPIRIGHRAAFSHSITVGRGVSEFEPKGKAADEIRKLYAWVMKRM